jgi:adenylate kinase family enzyme
MRAVVIGCSGSGKTTMAKQLAIQQQVCHIELDALHWLPNWQMREANDFRTLVTRAVAQEQWVTDGNYQVVRDIVWGRATTVIWLNYPFWRVMGRLMRRTLKRAYTQELLFSGNRESFRQSFLHRDSILWYALTHYHAIRKRYRQIFDKIPCAYSHIEWIELKTPSATQHYLRSHPSDQCNQLKNRRQSTDRSKRCVHPEAPPTS